MIQFLKRNNGYMVYNEVSYGSLNLGVGIEPIGKIVYVHNLEEYCFNSKWFIQTSAETLVKIARKIEQLNKHLKEK